MTYLLDTNVVCEPIKAKPNLNVKEWFDSVQDTHLFLSVLTLGEVRKGVVKMEDSKRKYHLLSWLERDLGMFFGERLLPIDNEVADRWGYIAAKYGNLPTIDGLLAATALVHDLVVVTRNVKDFQITGLRIINPWLD